MQRKMTGSKPLLLSALLILAPAYAAADLPHKAFKVDGGLVSVSGGVMPGPEATKALPIGKLKYPTRYFINLRNESAGPLWLNATWTFPEKNKNKPAKPKSVRSQVVPPQVSYWFYFDKLGVLVDRPIVIEIQAYADEKLSNLVGSQTAELIFDQASVDHFLANFPGAFKNPAGGNRQMVMISGWLDIPPPRVDIPGTLADGELQVDIQQSIWKADSAERWNCEREVLGAAPVSVDASGLLSALPGTVRQKAQREQADNTLRVERWTVKSCGQEFDYEVLMSAPETGGTDVMVINSDDLPVPTTK